jgi:hypothetical protein
MMLAIHLAISWPHVRVFNHKPIVKSLHVRAPILYGH